MSGKLPEITQRDLFHPMLKDFIDPEHKLVLLADTIDRQYFENGFGPYCPEHGTPNVPIRVMAGCLILKHLYNPGDGTLAKRWEQDSYFQYFYGMTFFEHHFPFDPGGFVHFHKRAGEEGMGKIFACSVHLHGLEIEKTGCLYCRTPLFGKISQHFPRMPNYVKRGLINTIKLLKEKELSNGKNSRGKVNSYFGKPAMESIPNVQKKNRESEKNG